MENKKPIIIGVGVFIIVVIIVIVLALSGSSNSGEEFMSFSIYKDEQGTIYSSFNNDKNNDNLTSEGLLTKYICEHPGKCGHSYNANLWFIIDGDNVLVYDVNDGPGTFTNIVDLKFKDIEFTFDKNIGEQKVRLVFFTYDQKSYYGAFGENVNFDYRNFSVSLAEYNDTYSFDMAFKKVPNGVSDYEASIYFTSESLNANFIMAVMQYKENNTINSFTTLSYLNNNKYEEIKDISGFITIKELDNYYLVTDTYYGILVTKDNPVKPLFTYSGEAYVEKDNIYYIHDEKLCKYNNGKREFISIDGTPLRIYGKYMLYLDEDDNICLYSLVTKKIVKTTTYKVSNMEDLTGEYDEGLNQLILYNEDKSIIFNFTKNTVTVFDSID